MKRIFLFGMAALSISAFAQAPQKTRLAKVTTGVEPMQATKTVKEADKPSVVRVNGSNKSTATFGKGAEFQRTAKVGETFNNQQTNGSVAQHVYLHAGGKVSVTWTTAQDNPSQGSNSRGSGYNHFNGTSWLNATQASLRIDPERTGFPCYAYSAATNEEMIISHVVKASGTPNAGAATGLMLNRKTGLGAGTWTGTTVLDSSNIAIPGVLWNRSVVSGNYLHVFASFTDSGTNQPNRPYINGVRTPQVYSRLNISGNTWEVKKQVLTGYNSDRIWSGGGDNYAMDARGSNVAILIGGLTDDMMLFKSTDNGDTWTKTIIDSFPVPAYDYKTLVDTAMSNDGTVSVVLDADGNAHCFWAISQVLDNDTTDNSVTFFRGAGLNEIRHWKEGTPLDSIQIIGQSPDADGSGALNLSASWNATSARYGNISITSMPHASIVGDTIFMIFSGMTEGDADANGRNYRDVFLTYSTDKGATWDTTMQNLTQYMGFNLEEMYASISPTSDANLHITFSQSSSIGAYDATNNPDALGPYDLVYMSIPKSSILAKKTGISTLKNEVFNVVSNYPNPFNGKTNISVNFKQSTNAVVKVLNVMGQEVYNQSYDKIPAGLSNLEVNLSNVAAGVYFYSIEANGFKATGKMIAE
ncbi:MAG: T9SS type A sorting domain-containing protein [Bacteroidota bacterium]